MQLCHRLVHLRNQMALAKCCTNLYYYRLCSSLLRLVLWNIYFFSAKPFSLPFLFSGDAFSSPLHSNFMYCCLKMELVVMVWEVE